MAEGDSGQRVAGLHLVFDDAARGDVREVVCHVRGDVPGSQELRIEVPRREPEARALVAADDDAEVVGRDLAAGTLDSARAVVVRGERERPTREGVAELPEQA